MELKVLFLTARCVTVEVEDGSIFNRKSAGTLLVNGLEYTKTDRVVSTIYDLKPDQDYEICFIHEGVSTSVMIHTKQEFVTLNVREFGAKGDGFRDDTPYIQAAIMACPAQSRVLIPKGTYRITSLFLKSDINIEIGLGAVLLAETDRQKFPVLPGKVKSCDPKKEYHLGTWEGAPLPMYAGMITGLGVQNVAVYGQGSMDGLASTDNWWHDVKKMKGAYRPRMIFLERCKRVTIQGISLRNSPSWTIHPYFSSMLKFIDIAISNPVDSPNTDGLDPESCQDVEITGVRFSLGDDCIAVKSGKIYMGRTYKTPSENIRVRQCLMEHGHGAVTIGSEAGAGVRSLYVEQCLFRHTDRGLRIKTRRGRGEDSVLDEIYFERIHMEHVLTPFVVNSFYFCDPDGKTEYVQSRQTLPVDERTPSVKKLYFHNIKADHCHVAAAFLCGLPEKKIERIELKDIDISFSKHAVTDVPAMLTGIKPCSRRGFLISNVDTLICHNVKIRGQEGEAFELEQVENYIMR